jgi:hypothetical protein
VKIGKWPSNAFAADILDRFGSAAYMPGHDDVDCIHRPPPPPYCHGTGALWRVGTPVPPDFGRGTVDPLAALIPSD